MLKSISTSSNFLRTACFHRHHRPRPQTESALLQDMCLTQIKLTSGWQPNATRLSVATHKVSSGKTLLLKT